MIWFCDLNDADQFEESCGLGERVLRKPVFLGLGLLRLLDLGLLVLPLDGRLGLEVAAAQHDGSLLFVGHIIIINKVVFRIIFQVP